MGMIRNLQFVLSGKDASASRTFEGVGRKADGLSSKLGKLGPLAAGAGAAVGAGVVLAAPKILGMAAQMETLDAKARTVFGGKALGDVQKWAKTNAGAMGLTSKEAVGLSAGFADLLIPMGFTRDQAAKMSTDVVGLSGALSQWSGGTKSAAEVSEILSAAMLGETDGLKSLGISIGAADIEARLLAKGQDKLTGAARQQAEAQATQALIMEKSVDAQTAYKNSGKTLLGQQQRVTAGLKEFRDKAIAATVPLLLKLADFVRTRVVPALRRLIDGFKDGEGAGGKLREGFDKIREAVEKNRPQLEKLATAFGKVVEFIATKVLPILAVLVSDYLAKVISAIGKVVTAFEAIKGPIVTALTFVIDKVVGFFGVIVNGAAAAFGWVPGLGGKLKAAAEDFDRFKTEVNNSLAGINDKEVKIRFKTYGQSELNEIADEKAGRRNGVTPTAPGGVSGGRRNVTANLGLNVDGQRLTSAVSNTLQSRTSRGYLATG